MLKRGIELFKFAFGKPKVEYDLATLKTVHEFFINHLSIHERNLSQFYENLGILSRAIVWADKNDSEMINYFIQHEILLLFALILRKNPFPELEYHFIFALNLIFENVVSESVLGLLYGNDYLNILIMHPWTFKHPQAIELYSCFLKIISFRINSNTIHYFFDSNFNEFPLLRQALKLHDHSIEQIRITACMIFLHILKVKYKPLENYMQSEIIPRYVACVISRLHHNLHKFIEMMFIFSVFSSEASNSDKICIQKNLTFQKLWNDIENDLFFFDDCRFASDATMPYFESVISRICDWNCLDFSSNCFSDKYRSQCTANEEKHHITSWETTGRMLFIIQILCIFKNINRSKLVIEQNSIEMESCKEVDTMGESSSCCDLHQFFESKPSEHFERVCMNKVEDYWQKIKFTDGQSTDIGREPPHFLFNKNSKVQNDPPSAERICDSVNDSEIVIQDNENENNSRPDAHLKNNLFIVLTDQKPTKFCMEVGKTLENASILKESFQRLFEMFGTMEYNNSLWNSDCALIYLQELQFLTFTSMISLILEDPKNTFGDDFYKSENSEKMEEILEKLLYIMEFLILFLDKALFDLLEDRSLHSHVCCHSFFTHSVESLIAAISRCFYLISSFLCNQNADSSSLFAPNHRTSCFAPKSDVYDSVLAKSIIKKFCARFEALMSLCVSCLKKYYVYASKWLLFECMQKESSDDTTEFVDLMLNSLIDCDYRFEFCQRIICDWAKEIMNYFSGSLYFLSKFQSDRQNMQKSEGSAGLEEMKHAFCNCRRSICFLMMRLFSLVLFLRFTWEKSEKFIKNKIKSLTRAHEKLMNVNSPVDLSKRELISCSILDASKLTSLYVTVDEEQITFSLPDPSLGIGWGKVHSCYSLRDLKLITSAGESSDNDLQLTLTRSIAPLNESVSSFIPPLSNHKIHKQICIHFDDSWKCILVKKKLHRRLAAYHQGIRDAILSYIK